MPGISTPPKPKPKPLYPPYRAGQGIGTPRAPLMGNTRMPGLPRVGARNAAGFVPVPLPTRLPAGRGLGDPNNPPLFPGLLPGIQRGVNQVFQPMVDKFNNSGFHQGLVELFKLLNGGR